MTILDTIKKSYKDKGEESMWQAVEAVSAFVESIREKSPEECESLERDLYELMEGEHYNKEYAEEDSANIAYTDKEGHAHMGPHWPKDEVCEAWQTRTFPEGTTCWDKYMAANTMYADLCKAFTEEQILEVAYLFFFCDEDGGENKVWRYFRSMR